MYQNYDDGRMHHPHRQSMSYGGHSRGYSYDQSPEYYEDEMFEPGPFRPSHILQPPMGPMPMSRGTSYDDVGVRDGYYDDRQLAAIPMAPMPSSRSHRRQRRHSMSSNHSRLPSVDSHSYYYHNPGSLQIRFRRKGGFMAGPGISFGEAQSYHTVSESDHYSLHDLHAVHGCMLLRVQWAGYKQTTYSIPVEQRHGRIVMQTLARRIARACVHYLQTRMIPVPWDRVELHHLEEVSYGTWQPMLLSR